ncbi:unnamed protein product, partial [marine sediment metagenome]
GQGTRQDKGINDAEEQEHSVIKNKVLDEVTEKYPDWEKERNLSEEDEREYQKTVNAYYDERLKKAKIKKWAKIVNFDRNKIAKKDPKGATAASVKIVKEIKSLIGTEDGVVGFKVGDVDARIDVSISDTEKETSDFEFYIDDTLIDEKINSSTFYFHELEKLLSADKVGRFVTSNIQGARSSIRYYEKSDVKSRRTLEKLQFKEDEKLAEKRKRYAKVVEEVNALEEQMAEQREKKKNKYIAADVERFGGGEPLCPSASCLRTASIRPSDRLLAIRNTWSSSLS